MRTSTKAAHWLGKFVAAALLCIMSFSLLSAIHSIIEGEWGWFGDNRIDRVILAINFGYIFWRVYKREPFQERVADWMKECFSKDIVKDARERADRFCEEALELCQTMEGFDAERAHTLVDYVFSRPVGDRGQEIGGVMVTLAALCNATDEDAFAEGEKELKRINRPEITEKIRKKQQAKRDIHGPLP